VADIAAGGWHSMALSADGQIYVWGRCGAIDRHFSMPGGMRGVDSPRYVLRLHVQLSRGVARSTCGAGVAQHFDTTP
jgi:alpha-tubulin suppressor-like RCC1 family protein